MSALQPAADTTPADWILEAARTGDAPSVLRYGPPGFDVYLRLPVDGDVPLDVGPGAVVHPMEAALGVLAAHTTTPDVAHVGLWHGHGFDDGVERAAPKAPLPNAWMYLYTGPVSRTRYAAQVVWALPDGTPDTGIATEPDLVWPADHAWCLACEVDEEIEFSIGCSVEAAAAVEAALPGRVRRVSYGEDVPWERDRTPARGDGPTC